MYSRVCVWGRDLYFDYEPVDPLPRILVVLTFAFISSMLTLCMAFNPLQLDWTKFWTGPRSVHDLKLEINWHRMLNWNDRKRNWLNCWSEKCNKIVAANKLNFCKYKLFKYYFWGNYVYFSTHIYIYLKLLNLIVQLQGPFIQSTPDRVCFHLNK